MKIAKCDNFIYPVFLCFFLLFGLKYREQCIYPDISGGFSLFFYLASCDNQFLIHFLK